MDQDMDIEQRIVDLQADYEANPTFDKLAKLKRIMVVGQYKSYDGFRRLLTDLYPDTAHFVYELLQNAQDASKNNTSPSKVTFILFPDKLEFEHYGEKLFDVADIDAITSLGASTKRDDNTSIGKFGVGFKSVFAYSNTPEIHSGSEHFKIEDLFIPTTIGVERLKTGNKTVFILPFNNPSKGKDKAVREIEQELRGLGTETLLFLKNISKIEYLLPDGNTLGSMECKRYTDNDENIIEIVVNTPGEEEISSYWLRYTQEKVCVKDESGKSIECSIAVAYKLEKDTTKEQKSDWKIVSCNPGKVCIFFPAEKETSKLNFYIHAPFASTVARDSVRDCEANNILRDAIAKLIISSLKNIKERKLLTIDFLGFLPIVQDGLSPFYEPIRKEIVEEFKRESLVPTKTDDNAPATTLYRGPVAISDIIGDEDLAFLCNRKLPLWAKNAPQQNQREDRFLDSLDIAEWSWKELHYIFNAKTDEERIKIEQWISRKPDEWLMRLYALLNNDNFTKLGNIDNSLRIVRTTRGHHVKAIDAYFVPNDYSDMPYNLHFVKPEVYKTGDTEKRKKDAEAFLDILGVKRYNEREKVALRLNRYNNKEDLKTDEKYFEDLKFFIDYSAKHPNDIATFQNERFLIGERGGKSDWISSLQLRLIIDETKIEVAELSDLLADNYMLWSGYNTKSLGEIAFAEFSSFLKRIGAKAYTHDELMKVRADRYSITTPNVTIEQHIKDMAEFLSYSQAETLLKSKCFVLGTDDKYHIANTLSVYPMSAMSHIHGIVGASEKYGEMKADLERLIIKLGAESKLKIVKEYNYTEKDFTINHLAQYINTENRSVITAILIMYALSVERYNCWSDDQYEWKYTRRDGRCKWRSGSRSTLVHSLKNTAWLPDNNGNYCLPCDISKENLHPDITEYLGVYDDRVPLLKAIGFGDKARQQQQEESSRYQQVQAEQERRNEALEELGLTEDKLLKLQEIAEAEEEGIDVAEALSRERERREKQERRRNAFPQRPASNPDVRASNTQSQYTNAVVVTYEIRERSVRSSIGNVDKQIYLRDMYTNDDGEMFCQICKEVMPFKKRDGEYYFEAIPSFLTDILLKEFDAKYLALCPVCAAKYNEFVQRGQAGEAFRYSIINCDELDIPIELGEENTTVRFVEKHLVDLRAILASGKSLVGV